MAESNTVENLTRLSDMVSNMKPSATIKANNSAKAKAAELEKQGKKLIAMTLGETPFPPDSFVVEGMAKKYAEFAAIFDRAKEAKNDPSNPLTEAEHKEFTAAVKFYKYSPVAGKPETLKAIKEYTEGYGITGLQENNVNNIVISNGAKGSISNLIEAVIGSGDEVMTFSPAWVSYFDLVGMSGGKVTEVPTSGVPTPDQVRQALKDNPNTKLMMLNPVSNPTGLVMSKEDRSEIAGIIREERQRRQEVFETTGEPQPDLIAMVDDIYKDLRFDGTKHEYSENENKLFEEGGMVIIDGLAKSFNMTGTRIGWAVGPQDVVKAMVNIQTNRSANISSDAQLAATLALTSPNREQLLEEQIEIFKERKNIVLDGLSKIDGITIDKEHNPEGAFYVYANVKGLLDRAATQTTKDPYDDEINIGELAGKKLKTTDNAAEYLQEAAYVAGTSGNGFRNDGIEDGHIRFSVGGENEDLVEGVKRISDAVGQLQVEKEKGTPDNNVGGGSSNPDKLEMPIRGIA